jgi:hypothetical protein
LFLPVGQFGRIVNAQPLPPFRIPPVLWLSAFDGLAMGAMLAMLR